MNYSRGRRPGLSRLTAGGLANEGQIVARYGRTSCQVQQHVDKPGGLGVGQLVARGSNRRPEGVTSVVVLLGCVFDSTK